ncbi:unnamed protein product [Rhizoctonia solani]|uniref:Laminin domain protein n=1 Tax=Rhizoctonia solani TaxID=456999 RepID=A0A8H3E4Z0_9AGAM|nr:unnamed protein product [Rhizoctonia solani]
MTRSIGWYPSGQVHHPPELPTYLKKVYDLKPIVGVPSDAEVIGIHAVLQAAYRASGIPGMHDSSLFMGLTEHLFRAQMARYRSMYSLVAFSSDSIYMPPTLPAHIPVKLEPISGTPSDEEITKVQEAVLSYQQFSHAPSMFDPHMNMELSQHLFDLQMARYMRRAGESEASLNQETTQNNLSEKEGEGIANLAQETTISDTIDNVGVKDPTKYESEQKSQIGMQDTGVREVIERSNQLAERVGEALGHINKVLVGIQHAMIRAQFGTGKDVYYNLHTMGCLVNHKGENIATLGTLKPADDPDCDWNVNFYLKSDPYSIYIPETQLAAYLKFYGLEEGLCFENASTLRLKDGMEALARERLGNFLTGCVG